MTPFARLPKRSSRRFLPGLASRLRSAQGNIPSPALPGVRREERLARRSVWTNFRADQRSAFGRRDHLGVLGAALVLVLMLAVTLAPRANVLDSASNRADTPLVQAEAHMEVQAEVPPKLPLERASIEG